MVPAGSSHCTAVDLTNRRLLVICSFLRSSLSQLPAGLSTQAHLPSKDKLSAHAKENAKGSNPGLEFKANQSGAGLSVGAKDIDEREK